MPRLRQRRVLAAPPQHAAVQSLHHVRLGELAQPDLALQEQREPQVAHVRAALLVAEKRRHPAVRTPTTATATAAAAEGPQVAPRPLRALRVALDDG